MSVATLVHGGDVQRLLATYGYVIVFAFVGAESIGVPLPGETTLTLAAIYAGTTHRLDIAVVIGVAAAGAVIGDNIGYAIGYEGGYRLLRRFGHYVRVDERRLRIGQYLFDRHGGQVVFFGRFVSILRTYTAFLAGTTRMRWRRFLAFNAAGGITWATIYGIGYYYFGAALGRQQRSLDIALAGFSIALLIAVFILVRRGEQILALRVDESTPRSVRPRTGDR